jgi:hypothetical protein
MAIPKKKVFVKRTCPYALTECLNLTECEPSYTEDYNKRIAEANQCRHRGDKLNNKQWLGHFKMVAEKPKEED